MSDVEADTVWIHCSLPDDGIGDLEATPRPAPLSRIQPRSTGVDSLLVRGDTATETDMISCAGDSDAGVIPETNAHTGIHGSTSFNSAVAPVKDDTTSWLAATQVIDDLTPVATTPVARLVSSPSGAIATHHLHPLSMPHIVTSPMFEIDILTELDFQQRQEERETARLAEEQANEYEHASQERLRNRVCIFEEVSSDETVVPRSSASVPRPSETVPRSSTAEDSNSDVSENPPQTLYCVTRAQHLAKRRSKQQAQHEYPVKRGGDSSDTRVVVRYPDISARFDVWRFGWQEMDARHGEVSKFRRAWLADYQADQRGYHSGDSPMFGIRLYYADRIYRAWRVLPDMYEELYYVDLFFRNKFYSAFNKRQPATTPSLQYRAWCNFVKVYVEANTREPNAYEKSLRRQEERFYSKSISGVAMKIHALSMKKQILCTVPADVECPSCYPGSSRGTIGPKPSQDLVDLHSRLYEVLNKQNAKLVTSNFSERAIVDRLQNEVSELRADVIMLQECNQSLQQNIAIEVANQLSQHRSVASNVMSNNC